MKAIPRPLLGAILGLLLGIVVVALLWQLGVAPPDRLVLFGILAITTALATIVLTQRVVLVRKRFIVIMIVCGLMGGAALTGIPEAIGGGSITGGCTAEATSSVDSKTPQTTSMFDPFDVTRTDTVAWKGKSNGVLTNWTSALGVSIGGFPVRIWGDTDANVDKVQTNVGNADVASYLADIEGSTGIALTGTYHLYGTIDGNGGSCEMAAYVRVEGAGAYTGAIKLTLWSLLAVLTIIILIMALVVRRSITRSALAAGDATATVGTGGSAMVKATGYDASNRVTDSTPPERPSIASSSFEPGGTDQPISPYAAAGAAAAGAAAAPAEPSPTEKLAEDAQPSEDGDEDEGDESRGSGEDAGPPDGEETATEGPDKPTN